MHLEKIHKQNNNFYDDPRGPENRSEDWSQKFRVEVWCSRIFLASLGYHSDSYIYIYVFRSLGFSLSTHIYIFVRSLLCVFSLSSSVLQFLFLSIFILNKDIWSIRTDSSIDSCTGRDTDPNPNPQDLMPNPNRRWDLLHPYHDRYHFYFVFIGKYSFSMPQNLWKMIFNVFLKVWYKKILQILTI